MELGAVAPSESLLPETLLPETSLQGPALPQEEEAFPQNAWGPSSQTYGMIGLMKCRDLMLPIAKPPEMVHFKLLVCPSFNQDAPEGGEQEPRESRRPGDRKGKGKGKDKNNQRGGRFVQDMGKTEAMHNTQRGQWWVNCGVDTQLEVVVRELFSLQSTEIWKIPPGHFVQQAGACEVFVSGRASGLQRMPVLPRGWVTVDAVAVGGPKYLEPIRVPRWKVVFRSGSSKGDIVVREGLSLESEECAVLLYGTRVDQSGPQEVLDDGIVRMPITFSEMVRNGPDAALAPRIGSGWVTCDATSQGGPKFFEACIEEPEPPLQIASSLNIAPEEASNAAGNAAASGAAQSSWDKNRTWKVVNLSPNDRKLAITVRAEPFQPGTGRIPAEDNLVKWIQDGDIVEQVGHSKKVRGYMVMPVRVLSSSEPDNGTTGWVTRRLVDKTRDTPDETWMVELRNGEEAERGERRKRGDNRRQRQGGQSAPDAVPAPAAGMVDALG